MNIHILELSNPAKWKLWVHEESLVPGNHHSMSPFYESICRKELMYMESCHILPSFPLHSAGD